MRSCLRFVKLEEGAPQVDAHEHICSEYMRKDPAVLR